MKAQDLRYALERHRKMLRGETVHLLGDRKLTVLSSTLLSGHVLRTTLPPISEPINCTVNAEVLLSLIPVADKELVLSDDGNSLRLSCGRSRGQVPSVADQPPEMPRASEGERARLSSKDLEWLRTVLPLLSISKTEKDGRTSIIGDGTTLRAGTYDEVVGAFAFRDTSLTVSVGLSPSDLGILNTLASAPEAELAFRPTDDNRVMARVANDTLVLPCIEAVVPTRDVVMGATKAHWSCTAASLAEAVSAMSVVAKAKDAGPIHVTCNDKGLLLSVRSPSGSLQRHIDGVENADRQHPTIGCNAALLQDILARMPKDARIVAYLETNEGPSTRLVLRTKLATYVILTSTG